MWWYALFPRTILSIFTFVPWLPGSSEINLLLDRSNYISFGFWLIDFFPPLFQFQSLYLMILFYFSVYYIELFYLKLPQSFLGGKKNTHFNKSTTFSSIVLEQWGKS